MTTSERATLFEFEKRETFRRHEWLLQRYGLAIFWFKVRSPLLDHLVDGLPVVVVDHGRPLRERMEREGIDDLDILTAARERRNAS